jgi:hypothetical protein
MRKPPKPSLKSIVASAATRRPHDNKVVHLRRDAATSVVSGRGTLKQRAKQMSVYLDPAVYDQLRDIAHTERTKMHPLILENWRKAAKPPSLRGGVRKLSGPRLGGRKKRCKARL